jgi:sugar lactone lactonase YvrE
MPPSYQRVVDLSELLHGAVSPQLDVVTAARVADCHCQLGECILFDGTAVLWTDIYAKQLHKLALDYATENISDKIVHSVYDLPKQLCSFGLLVNKTNTTNTNELEDEELPLLCAWDDGFQLYDVSTRKYLSEVSQGEIVNPEPGTRLNDGRVDPEGKRFICGGYFEEKEGIKMKVFQVQQQKSDGSLHHESVVDEIEVTNAICWNLDGTRMYLANSPEKKIWSHAYNANTTKGQALLSDKQDFHKKSTLDTLVPDGACVDADGFLWNACWNVGDSPGLVQRIDPKTGLVVYTVHIPDGTSQVSSCCFGGNDMDILFITTASKGRDPNKQPHAGALYAVKVPFKGKSESRLNWSI